MTLAVQDWLATLMALGSALIILRRMVGAFKPGKKSQACQHCASGAAACATVEPEDVKPVPLVLHRR
ncbi:MAG: hypothetical protein H0W08_04155 [Acidobacteria bacterium]|nr:hypothetical protein [Acidobacteriota bacterium]